MNSHSQAAQDRFAFELCDFKPDGSFLDIGCHDGRINSNSLALEEVGWRGLLVDIHLQPGLAARASEFLIADATLADWPRIFELYFPDKKLIDYLSLDADESTTAVLEKLTELPIRFRTITIEHDAYRCGPAARDYQRVLLDGQGYDLVCSDVRIQAGEWHPTGGPFEDWWANPIKTNIEKRNRLRCHNRHWSVIMIP